MFSHTLVHLLTACLTVVSSPAARAASVPQALGLGGQLFAADGSVLAVTPVNFTVQVFDSAETCVLYSEIHAGENLAASNGRFNLVLGTGSSRVNNLDGSTNLGAIVFANPGVLPVSNCSQTSVALSAGSNRLVRISYDLGSGAVALTPDVPLVSVASAMIADSLQGKAATDFIQVLDNGTSVLNQSNTQYTYSATNWPRLKALLDGTSTQYLPTTPTNPVSLNNQRVTNLSDPTAPQDAATKHYADTMLAGSLVDVTATGPMTGTGDVMQWDGTQNKWVAGPISVTATGSAGGDLTGTYPNPTIANNAVKSAKINATGIAVNRLLITNSTDGTTIGYGVCTLNQVYAWTATGWACTNVSALSPVTSVAGRTGAVTLTAADIGSLGTAALYDVGTGVSQIPKLNASAQLPAVDGSLLTNINAVQLQTRPVSANMPAVNQVLGWNGSAWTPMAAATGSVTTVSTGTGLLGGPFAISGTLSVDVGTGASKILQLNASAQIPAVDGSLLTNVNASYLATRKVSSVAPTVGQILGWNQTTTQWEATLAGATQWLNTGSNIYYNAGSVGIGTATPLAALDVATTGSISALLVPRDTVANRPGAPVNGMIRYASDTSKLEVYQNGTWQNMLGGSASSLPLSGLTAATSANSIDNLNFAQTWAWSTATTQTPLSLNANALTNASVLAVSSANPGLNSASGLFSVINSGTSTSGLLARFQANGAAGTGLSIATNGNVGIGTSVPSNALHVAGPLETTAYISSAVGNAHVYLSGPSGGQIQSDSAISLIANSNSPVVFSPAAVERARVTPVGLGIGTTAPMAGLDIATLGTTASAVIVPRDTVANRPNVPINGMIRYASDTSKLEVYQNGSWQNMLGGTASSLSLSGLTAATANNAIDNSAYPQSWAWSTATTQTPLAISANQLTTGSGLQISSSSGTLNSTNGLFSVANTGASTSGALARLQSNATAGSGLSVMTNGNVGVGSATPGATLDVLSSSTAASGTVNGVNGSLNIAPPAGSTGTNNALSFFGQYTGVGNASGVSLQGVSGSVINSWTGTIGKLYGLNAFVGAVNGGTVNNAYGGYFQIVPTSSTIVNSYGVFTDVIGGTNKWSFYANDPTAPSYFAGRVGVGTNLPQAALDVAASGSASAVIVPRDTVANRPTAPVNGMIRYASDTSKLEVYQNGSWQNMLGGSASSLALSGLTAATTSNSIDNSNFSQTWAWSTATTQTPFSLTANALTSGSLLSLASSSNALNSSTGLLNVINSGTSTNGLVARVQANGSAASGLTVLANGNVGVGSIAPVQSLDVAGSASVSQNLLLPLSNTAIVNWTTNWPAFQPTASNTAGKLIMLPSGSSVQSSLSVSGFSGFGSPNFSTFSQNGQDGFLQNGSPTGTLYLGAATSNTLALSPSGRVGIGVASPAAGLDIATLGTAASAIIVPRDTVANRPAVPVNGMIRYANDTSRFEAYQNGSWQPMLGGAASSLPLNGITSAVATNSIDNLNFSQTWNWSTATSQTLLGITANGLTTGSALSLSSSNGSLNSALGVLGVANSGTSTSGVLARFQANSTAGSGLTIMANGNLGVGSSTPLGLLDVKGGTPLVTNWTHFENNVGGTNPPWTTNASGLSLGVNRSNGGVETNLVFGSFYAGSGLAVAGWDGVTYSEYLRVAKGGNVGIGIAAPAAALDVTATGSGSAVIVPRDTVANRPTTPVNGMIRYASDTSKLEVYQNGSWQNMLGGSAASVPLSGLVAATSSNTIDNTNFPQSWNWSSATTQTTLSLNANALTTGSELALATTSASLNSTTGLLNVSNSGSSLNGVLARFQSNPTTGSGLTVLTNGLVGVGTSVPGAALDVQSTSTAASGAAIGVNNALYFNPSAGSTASVYGSNYSARFAGSGSSAGAGATGLGGMVSNDFTGTLGNATGVSGLVSLSNTGVINQAYASYFQVLPNSGTIVNAYGVYLGSVGGTNKWSIYASDATAPSFFASRVGIGTPLPQAALDLTASGASSAVIVPRDTVANRPTTPVNGMIRYASDTSKLEAYQNGSWQNMLGGTASSLPLSGIIAATATNSIDNLNFAQTWNWSTASSQTPVALTGNGLTTGSLLSLSSSNASLNSSGGLLNVANTGTSSSGMLASLQSNGSAGSGLYVMANGNVGVGTNAPTRRMHINGQTYTTDTNPKLPTVGVTAEQDNYQTLVTVNPSVNYPASSGAYNYLYNRQNTFVVANTSAATDLTRLYTWAGSDRMTYAANANTSQVIGHEVYSTVDTPSSANVGLLTGASISSQQLGTGTVTESNGMDASAGLYGTGSITTARGARGSVFHQSASTITNAMGLAATVQRFSSGAVTNGYGVYIDVVNATNSYGLYQASNVSRNYFAGSLGVGTTTPAAAFDVFALGTSASAIVVPRDTVANRPSVPVNGMIRYASDSAKLEAYQNGSWQNLIGGSASSLPLSGLTAATASNNIDNTNFSQAWNWSTATTQISLSLSANGLTTGSSLAVSSSSNALNSSKGLLSVAYTGTSTNGTLATILASGTTGAGLTVMANGNVGIGTTSSPVRLYVPSLASDTFTAAYFGDYSVGTASAAIALTNSGNGFYGAAQSGNGVYGSATSGFGVLGNSTSGYAIVGQSQTAISAFFQSSTQANSAPTVSIRQAGSGTADLTQWATTAGVPKALVSSSGFFAIGTTAPQAALDIASTGSVASAIIVPRDTVANRPSVPVNGMIRYASDSAKLEAYQNGSWQSIIGGPASGVPLSGLSAAVAVNSIDNLNLAQTWNWSTATSQTSLSLAANGLTTGGLLNLSSSSGTLASTQGLLNVVNTGTSTSGVLAKLQGAGTSPSGLIVTNQGSVGINTTAPQYPFDFEGANAYFGIPDYGYFKITNRFNIEPVYGTYSLNNNLINDGYQHNIYSFQPASQIMMAASGDVSIATWPAVANGTSLPFTSGIYLRNNGLVGIGTNTPLGGLDITATGTIASAVIVPRDTVANRPSVPVNGMIRYASDLAKFESYQNGTWQTLGGGAASNVSLSGLTAATTTNSIDSLNLPQTWSWSTATTQNPLTLAANTLTTGSGLSVSTSSPSFASSAGLLNVTNSGTSTSGLLARLQSNGSAGSGLTILANGNVGVGSSAPAQMLDVSGSTQVGGSYVLKSTGHQLINIGSFTPGIQPTTANQNGAFWVAPSGSSNQAALVVAGFSTTGSSNVFSIGQIGNVTTLYNGSPTGTLSLGVNATPQMTFVTNMVGVGTSTPAAGFDIATTGTIASALIVPRDTVVNRPSVPVNGMIRYASDTAKLEAYQNGSWQSIIGGTASGVPLSGLTAALAANAIDNTSFAQTWNWSAATTQVPLAITGNALTTGSVLQVSSSSPSLNSAGGLLNVVNSGTSTNGLVARVQANSSSTSGLSVLANGNVGIGTMSPGAALGIGNGSSQDGGIVALGTGTGSGQVLGVSGAGVRAYWYPRKAAFRAGAVTGSNWDDANVGIYSFATGLDSKASGLYSAALNAAVATGNYSTALGGYGGGSSGDYSLSGGVGSLASAQAAIALGFGASASGQAAISLGYQTGASGSNAVALNSQAYATGNSSLAAGTNTSAPGLGETAIGAYNAITGSENASAWVATDPVFVIGNGTSSATRTNALTVLKNGNFGISTTMPQAGLDVASTGTGASAMIVPRDTTANRPFVPINGMIRYNTNVGGFEGYSNGAWSAFSSGTSAGTVTSIATSTGLLGGPIVSFGTLSVDVGTAANKIVQESVNAQILQSNGTATLPTYSFTGSPDTGMYSPGTGQLALTAGGANRLYITAAGSIGIGQSNPGSPLEVNGQIRSQGLQLMASGFQAGFINPQNMELYDFTGNGPANPSFISLRTGRQAGPVSSGDSVGELRFSPNYNGYSGVMAAKIAVIADGVVSASSMPTRFSLFTTPNGSITPNEVVRIDSSGRFGIATTSPAAGLDVATTGTIASAIVVPRDTTANRPVVPVNGMIRYNSSLKAMEAYANGAWSTFSGGASGSGLVVAPTTSSLIGGSSGAATNTSNGDLANTTFGYQALNASTTGGSNAAFGAYALSGSTTAGANTAVGNSAMQNTSTGSENVAVGFNAMITNTSGSNNTAIGDRALSNGNGMFDNVAIGRESLKAVTGVGGNIGIGRDAGNLITSGANNVVIGYGTGSTTLTTGSNNILIGTGYGSVDTQTSSSSNTMNIGNLLFGTGMIGSTTAPAGAVGIGTAAPANMLDVRSDQNGQTVMAVNNASNAGGAQSIVRANSDGGHNVAMTAYSTGAGNVATVFANYAMGVGTSLAWPLTLYTTYLPRITIDQNGLVGIGTTSPASGLDIAFTGTTTSALIVPRDTTANRPTTPVNGMIRYNNNLNAMEAYANGAWSSLGGSAGAISGTVNSIPKFTGTSTLGNSLITDSGTGIGIGVTGPTALLDVEGADANVQIKVVNQTSTATRYPSMSVINFLNGQGGAPQFQGVSYEGTSGSPAAVVANDQLFVLTGLGGNGSGYNVNNGPYINMVATENWSTSKAGSAITFAVAANGSLVRNEQMRVDQTGNVGIGTNGPAFKLDVNGTIRGYGISDASDERLKRDVRVLADPLERLAQIDGVSFVWRDPARGARTQIGVIAQNVERIYPELVETDSAGVKSVNYSHLVAPIIEAIKSLYAKVTSIDERTRELAALAKRHAEEIARLREDNERLRAADEKRARELDEQRSELRAMKARLDRIAR